MIFKAKEIAQTLPEEKKILEEMILADRALDLGLQKILINPKLGTTQKSAQGGPATGREIIQTVLADKVSTQIINLIVFLAKEKRLNIFKKVLQEFERQLINQNKAVRAEIITVKPLDITEIGSYQKKLEEKLGKEVLLENKVDPQIIGGVIIKIGSQTIDNSFKTKLKALR